MTSTALIPDLVSYAVELASVAGEIALARFGTARSQRKADGSEVTDADLAIEDMIVRRIAARYADHGVIGEEAVHDQTRSGDFVEARYWWVVDPLDGTRNYVRQFPVFATSIAVLEQGRPIVGVIRWHHTGQVFAAAPGMPTTLGGEPVRVSQRPVDSNLLVGAQLGAHHLTQEVVAPWLSRWAVRNLGATAVHLALVATGGLDAAYAQDCRVWDLAAGALLIEQAGGQCTGLRGEPLFPIDPATCAGTNYPFLAGGPNAHRTLLEDLQTRASGGASS
ncbi:MAG: inositol monophosphatase [Planctomycetota bacterium]